MFDLPLPSGAGRSIRFLQRLGFRTVGIDLPAEMVAAARAHDPEGDYRVIVDGDFSTLAVATIDLVLAAFTFHNVPGHDRKVRLFAGLRQLLARHGRLVAIVSTPEIYAHESGRIRTIQGRLLLVPSRDRDLNDIVNGVLARSVSRLEVSG